MKPQEFKILQSNRLILQPMPVTFEFANYLYQMIVNNREFFKYMPWADVSAPEQEFAFLDNAKSKWKKQSAAIYGMYLRNTNEFVGDCSFFDISWNNESGEIGYWLDPKFANQGFMTEAVNTVAKEYFDMGFKRIVILANPENIASCKVAEKCGFEREGILRSYDFLPSLNKRENVTIYSKIME